MIIGFEGISCAGKTTLAAALAAHLGTATVVPCYYHAAPDRRLLPSPTAHDRDERLAGLDVLLGVESRRRQLAHEALGKGRTVILDRTVDTLLAHTYAIDHLYGLDFHDTAREAILQRDPVLPDVTFLLITPPRLVATRATRRPGMPPIFHAPDFAEHFNHYFEQALAPRCVRLAGDKTVVYLLDEALTTIATLIAAGTATSKGTL
ncbi:AAA family ATPase [Embleya sp. NPDC059237]|uniref:AAA family ATPase n=1 Tax=Embleya sp. NPDC059237 TaxID=3346784 RepID=UPI00369C9342